MQWQDCPPSPLAWFELRQPLLTLLFTPGLLLPLVGAFALILAWWWQLPRLALPAVALLAPLTLSVIYSPLATALLSGWLMAQVPPPHRRTGPSPLPCWWAVVLPSPPRRPRLPLAGFATARR